MAARLDTATTISPSARDQRHAVHRRDAGAADHLHGGGAARRPSTSHVDLPASTAEPQPRPDKPLFLTIKSDLTLASATTRSRAKQLAPPSTRPRKGDKDKRIFLRADKTVPYGELMEVMNMLRAAGYLKVALVGLEGVGGAAPAAAADSSPGEPGEPGKAQ